MKKRIIALVLCAVLMIGVMPAAAMAADVVDSGEFGDGLKWVLTKDYTLAVSGEGEMGFDYWGDAPWIDYISVIRSVVIENGVTDIADGAFTECYDLTSVDISASVTEIGDEAFWRCDKLSEVTISNGLKKIGGSAFWGCHNLTNITLPESVTSIGSYAFAHSGLSEITISANVQEIGGSAFERCDLTGIWVNEKNPNYSSDEKGVLFNKNKTELIQAPQKLTGSYTIPDSVTSIMDCAFEFCNNVTDVTMREGVTSIGYYSFYGCKSMISIDVPESVTVIGEAAFMDCRSLEEIKISANITTIGNGAFSACDSLNGIWVDEDNPNYSSDDRGVLFNKDKTEYLQAPGNFTGDYSMPETVVTMTGGFNWCHGLTSVTIPASVVDMSYNPFANCENLKKIVVHEDNPEYSSDENGVLYNKEKTEIISVPEKLTGEYVVPQSIEIIDLSSLENAWSITSIVFHKNVEEIFMGAFDNCKSLEKIIVDKDNPNYSSDDSGVLFDKNMTELIQAPMQLSGDYTVPDGVIEIGYGSFERCERLTSITIPESVTEIWWNTFRECRVLNGFKVDESSAFYCNDNQGVLYNKEKTMLIKAPCNKNGTYIVSNETVEVSDYAFFGCDKLNNIVLPKSITWIGDAFEGCEELENIYYRGTANDWENIDDEYSFGLQELLRFVPMGDMNGDGEVTNTDLIILARIIVGLD